MKRKNAKELLADSFRELAASKSVDKITVREIVDNCGYSMATFYRNYKDKYDLIAWDYAQGTARIMEQINEQGYSWRQTLLDGALRFERERDYLKNLFLHTTGQDTFILYMTEINYDALKKHILAVSGMDSLDEQTDMYVRVYCMGTVSLTCEWIFGRYQTTPEELAEVFEKSLPVPLHKYLL